MKLWQLVLLGSLGVCGLGLTNPGSAGYEIYAANRVGDLAKDECNRAASGFGVAIEGTCRAAIDAYKPQLRSLLAATTTRQNWILFSIYRSNISIPEVRFNARVESIGILNNFFTYKSP